MIQGLLGRKLGMLQTFDKEGRLRGATVIEAGPCLVIQIKTDETDGYAAVQLGFGIAKHTNKPKRGHLKRLGDLRYLREFKADDSSQHKVGDRIGVEIFQEGDRVDVTGTSIGRVFAGGVKRHGFHGGPKTHGQSDRHRAPAAIGAAVPGPGFAGQGVWQFLVQRQKEFVPRDPGGQEPQGHVGRLILWIEPRARAHGAP